MSPIEVRAITADETIPLRQAILRAGLPREAAIFAGDEAADSRHFGASLDGRLVGVATIHFVPVPDWTDSSAAYQVRGMATAREARGLGVGSAVLAACLAEAHRAGARWIWCNARTPAAGFYKRHGFETTGGVFEIPTAGPHYRMIRAV